MRLVIVNDKLIGRELAYSIYTESGVLFMAKGNLLTDFAIKRLRKMGIVTVYIEDGNEDMTLQETLPTQIKLRILKSIREVFEEIKSRKTIKETVVVSIISEILQELNLSENAVMVDNLLPNDEIAKLALHSLNVAIVSIMVSAQKKYSEKKLISIGTAALLHDIGKLITEDSTSVKTGYELVKSNISFGPTIYMPIYQQNEREDGSGPLKLKGEAIFEPTKILTICNEFIDITSSNEGILPHEAVEKITAAATTKFDSNIYRDFIKSIYCYPNGLPVRLNNGASGVVIAQNKGSTTRPIIAAKENGVYTLYDLMKNLTLFIEKVIL